MPTHLRRIGPFSTIDNQHIQSTLKFSSRVHPEVVDRIYVLTSSAIEEKSLSVQFGFYGSSLDCISKESGFRNFEDMVVNCDQFHFLQIYVMKDKNQKFIKIFFNEEGYEKIKEAQEYFGHISDLRRPEGAVQIKYEELCLFHQRYDEACAKGRLALVNLLGLRYDPNCINSFPIEIVNRFVKEIHEEEDIINIGEFRRKYFPGVASLSSVINRFCFEEIEFVDAIFTLKVDPEVFKRELLKKIEYRKIFFDELEDKLKRLSRINFKPRIQQENDSKNIPRFCGNRTVSVSEFEDDVRIENQPRRIQNSEANSESSRKSEKSILQKKESPIVMCFHRSNYNRVILRDKTSLNLCPSEDEESEESKSLAGVAIIKSRNNRIPEHERERFSEDGGISKYEQVQGSLEDITTNAYSSAVISSHEEESRVSKEMDNYSNPVNPSYTKEPNSSRNIHISKYMDALIPSYEDVESD